MKIKLLKDIPVDKQHGLTAGREMETVEPPPDKVGSSGIWVKGNRGEKVRLMPHEWRKL